MCIQSFENELRTVFCLFVFSLCTFENYLNLFKRSILDFFLGGGGIRKRGANFTSCPRRYKPMVRHWGGVIDEGKPGLKFESK